MATIKEVAERAHVSIATVSYVLNGTGSVSPSKRRLVLEAAAALNYRPSYRGRALQAQRSMTLGLVLPAAAQRVADPSFGELLAGMADGAARRGYHILLAPSTMDQPEAGMHHHLFRSGRVDGVIILDTQFDDPRIAMVKAEQIPYICAGRSSDDSPFVAIDGQAGMMEAMAHLIVCGHERISLIQPPLEQTLTA